MFTGISARPFFWPLLLAATLLCASGWPVPPAAPSPSWINPHAVAHFLVFGLFATLVCRCFGEHAAKPRSLLIAFLITAFFGVCDELRQSYNPVRDSSISDGVLDILGAAVALLAYGFWPAYRRTLESSVSLPWPRRTTKPPAPKVPRAPAARVALPSAAD